MQVCVWLVPEPVQQQAQKAKYWIGHSANHPPDADRALGNEPCQPSQTLTVRLDFHFGESRGHATAENQPQAVGPSPGEGQIEPEPRNEPCATGRTLQGVGRAQLQNVEPEAPIGLQAKWERRERLQPSESCPQIPAIELQV